MKQKLKILHLTASFAIGGAQRLILGLAKQTNCMDFEIYVFFFGKFKKNLLQPDFEALDDISLSIYHATHFYKPNVLQDLVSYIRLHQIDIVQTHMIDADIIGRMAARFAGVPVISTWQNEPRGYDSCRFYRRWLERWTAYYLMTHSVAVSRHIRKMFIEDWHIPEDRISTIYNAIVLDDFMAIPPKVEFEHPMKSSRSPMLAV